MDNTEKKKLFKIRKTCVEMIEDRGFIVPEIIKNVSFNEYKIMFDNNNIDIHIKDDKKEAYIFFHIGPKNFGKNDLKNTFSRIVEETKNSNILIIMVLKDKPNNTVLKEIKNAKYFNTELFERKRLTFNITKHILVPKHILLNKEEKEKVLEKFNATISQLPKILKDDPVAKYYGMKVGDVCKVIRRSKQIGESIAYRSVE